MKIVRAGLRAFVLPLVRPLATAHGPVAERAGFLVTLEDESGRFGSGEATPLPAFGGEHRTACRAALLRALGPLADGSERSLDAAFRQIAGATRDAPCARSAIESALADLAAQCETMSLARWLRRRAGLPGEPATGIRAQALVGGSDPEAVRASAEAARGQGFEVFKLKLAVTPAARGVSQDFERDLERVAALRAAIGGEARIRLDANEAWNRREAERALARLAPFRIEFIEQPVARADLEGLAGLARTGAIAIAADEALLAPGGLEACLSRRCVEILIAKPAVLGGITATIELAVRARAAGIRVVFSNLIEGRVGRELAIALAAALVDGEEVHGLGTADLLARDFERAPESEPEPLGRPGSWLIAHAGAGLGVSPGPCWAIEGEILGELLRFEAGAPVAPAADVAGAALAAGALSTGWLERFVPAHAARTALVFAGRASSYAELAEATRAAGEGLAACGLVAGDLVAVLAPPSAAGVVLIHAMFERGIVLLPLNSRLSESEIAQALAATRTTALLVSQAADLEQAERLARGAACALLVFTSSPDPTALAPSLARRSRADASDGSGCGDGRVDDGGNGATSASDLAARATALRRDHAALVLLTSGTSGRAKAAVLTRENLLASADASARMLGHSADDRWLLCLPLFHIAGLSILVRAALSGACVFLEPRFDAVRVARALDASRISHVSFVATTLEQVLDARGPRPAPTSLRLVLLGGGPASESLLARAVAAGFPIAATYGLTEAASQVATRPPRVSGEAGAFDAATHGDGASIGGGLVPLPGVEVRIVDEGDRPVDAGVEGEIQLRGPIVMRGYLDDPESTARALRGGWLATGDIGRLDGAGRLRVLDRRSDLIVSGGENVYPAEIESVLIEHPDVVEAGVVGVGDARFGARPLAFVVWRAGAARDSRLLADWCRERLAGYKRPVEFVAVELLPRNASGKLLRRELALRAVKGDGAE